MTMVDEATLESFKTRAIACLEAADKALLDKCGDIIQCPASALREGQYYVMGFNPGGETGDSIRETTRNLDLRGDQPLAKASGNYWRNLQRLMNVLDEPPVDSSRLFITNLFPDCSTRASQWKKAPDKVMRDYVKAIWKLHKLMLSFVKPRFIIVSGISQGSAFKLLWENFHPCAWDDTMSPHTKELDPQIKSFSLDAGQAWEGDSRRRVTFIGVRHFSYGGPRKPEVVKALIDFERTKGSCAT